MGDGGRNCVFAVGLLGVVAAGALGAGTRPSAAPHPTAGASRPARPNIVLVLTDDLDSNLGTLERLPELRALLADTGLSFRNAFVSESLCCPSRASTQLGEYVHNHRVLGNKPPDGGFERFHALREEQSTIGTWLHAAGYRTGYLGKYLNGYPDTAAPTFVPPGWDAWVSPAAGNAYGEFRYALNEDGALVNYGNAPGDYLTDVLAGKAARFVRESAKDQRPFFLFVATYAPHQPATPAPRHAEAFPDVRAPRPPSYDEEDVSDKPEWLRSRRRLAAGPQQAMDHLYRKRLQSMLAVQDLMQGLLAALEDSAQLDRTYVFFTSDNGFHMGEHRLHAGKLTAFEEDIHVPLFVRGPGVPAGRVRAELVGNIDLAPTFAELAGVPVPEAVDGRSLVPLLHASAAAAAWRGALLVEQDEIRFKPGEGLPPRGVLEPLDPQEEEMSQAAKGKASIPAYDALRSDTRTYVEYSTGEKELYDLRSDPYELSNAFRGADPALVARLHAWLDALRKCRGAGCRVADVGPRR